MAYQTGSATSWVNLMSILDTFMVANGWTQDDLTTTISAWNKNSVYIQLGHEGNPQHVGVYQSTGYTPAGLPGNHPGDSGNGFNTNSTRTDANHLTERCIEDAGDGPFPSYHIFEKDSSPAYVHVVIQTTTSNYRHFGFGEITKYGSWTGGEYCYGQFQAGGGGITSGHSVLLDGYFDSAADQTKRKAATIRCSSLPGQAGGSIWGEVWGGIDGTAPTDTAANAKVNIAGNSRGGTIARSYGMMAPASSTAGLIPMWPISIFYVDNGNSHCYPLGRMQDVRQLNMGFFAPEDIVTIAADDWVIFPYALKEASGGDFSRNGGIAYKKVTA